MPSTEKWTSLSSSLKVSKVITGLWQVADLERDGKTVDQNKMAQGMNAYADAGFTTFDMADHYGSAEEIAGLFAQQYKSAPVQLLTKWVPKPGKVSKQDVADAVESSLTRMQASSIDLLQFHAWNYADPTWLDCLFWLQELKEHGKIKNLGVTNFDTAHLRIAVTSGINIISNQVCYSLLDQRASKSMHEFCLSHNVRILAFGTIAGGFLSEKWLGKPEPMISESLSWSQMKYKRFIDTAGGWDQFQSLLQVLDLIAKKHHLTIPLIASRFILEDPAAGAVIIGARPGLSDHINDNKKLLEFSLDTESITKIKDAISTFTSIPGDCGDEYRKPPYLTASGDLSHHVDNIPPPFPTITDSSGKIKALSGTVWEDMAGFSRAVRKGNRILVSGTTATHGDKAIGGNDPTAQMHFVIDKIEGAIQSLGGTLEDVVRTRIYVSDVANWEPIARAHGERFKNIQPANTLINANLIGDEYLIEMEAEAELSS